MGLFNAPIMTSALDIAEETAEETSAFTAFFSTHQAFAVYAALGLSIVIVAAAAYLRHRR